MGSVCVKLKSSFLLYKSEEEVKLPVKLFLWLSNAFVYLWEEKCYLDFEPNHYFILSLY